MRKRISIITLCIALLISMTPIPGFGGVEVWADTSNNDYNSESGSLDAVDIAIAEVALEEDTFIYDGSAPHPTVSVAVDGSALIEGEDYELLYDDSATVGDHNILITGIGKYSGSTSAQYKIVKKPQAVTVAANEISKCYDDPEFNLDAISDGNGELIFDCDNESVATVTSDGVVTICGLGDAHLSVYAQESEEYERSESVEITLHVTKHIPNVALTDSYTKVYGDEPFLIDVETDSDGELVFSSSNPSVVSVDEAGMATINKAGTAEISVYSKATDSFEESLIKTVNIEVAKATQKVTVTSKYTKTIGNSAFTVKAATNGDGKLKFSTSNKKVATVSSAGKVTIRGVGTAKITVYAAAGTNYSKSSSKTITIVVNPKRVSLISAKNSGKNKVTVKWKKGSSINGYQIEYSTKSDFSKSKKATVSSASTVSKTLSGLTKGYTYYVRVRTFKTVGGNKYYSTWSSKKSVKVSKGVTKYLDKKPTIKLKATNPEMLNHISWAKTSGATGYKVYYRKGDNGKWTLLKTTTGTSVDHKVTHGVTYYYRARAYKNLADGSVIYSKYSNTKDFMHYFEPSFRVILSSKSDSSARAIAVIIGNNGSEKMRVYSDGAQLIDRDYDSFDRDLYLTDAEVNPRSYIDIDPGDAVMMVFMVDGTPTWYDSKSTLTFWFRYDGMYYKARASNYYGVYY